VTIPLDINDPRWQLTLRVLRSPLFDKSPRLSDFLKYICRLELTGRRSEINEHQIGVEVFGRNQAYNSGEDGIVRSQARFLRQRLDEYFRTVGRNEPIRIAIPKGGYIPLFEENPALEASSAVTTTGGPAESSGSAPSANPSFHGSRYVRIVAVSCVMLLAIGLTTFLAFHHGAKPFQSPDTRFWSTIFDPHRTLTIVPADSTLILIEELTGKQVSLQSYLAHGFITQVQLPDNIKTLTSSDLEVSHYTSMADLNFVSRIMQIPEIKQVRTEVRYARDLSISEAKQHNLVLIGGPRANPWATLFADRMNFYVDYDWKTRRNVVINKSPRAGEAALYTDSSSGPVERVYGLIAYEASLDHDGNDLLIAGTNSAGTQTAADFLLTGQAFDDFLRKIRRPDESIPHFEVLLEAQSLNGNVPESRIIAYRSIP
jgi:hypothetical protein